MDKDLTLDEVTEQWETLRQSILDLVEAMTEILAPVFRQVIDVIHAFIVQLQRFQLLISLTRHWWIPNWFAHWLSDRWPERWLPELKMEGSDS